MPIFQDDLHPDDPLPDPAAVPEPPPPTLARKLSEESIRTEFCEGPVPDSPKPAASPQDEHGLSNATSDRAELIERLKRGESPTWIPNRHVSSAPRAGRVPSPGRERAWPADLRCSQLESFLNQHGPAPAPRTPRSGADSPGLLPAADITPDKAEDGFNGDERLQDGLNIERPRSALHSGDFTPDEASPRDLGAETNDGGSRIDFPPSRHSWIATSPPRDFSSFPFNRRSSFMSPPAEPAAGYSSLSCSLSSSFVYKPPTSPLVQSLSNDDMDLSLPLMGIEIGTGSPVNPRRHTMSFAASSPFAFPPSRGPTPNRQPLHRREHSLPYQAHQPRRSLTSTPNISLLGLSPQTPPFLRSRRPSFSSDASPLQASMVGSYEESILRGRMSTHPSKPLEFLAQIGVLGLGKCKSRLRCPPHVTLPFSAVFYSYGNGSQVKSGVEDGPSPYVGQIDLENGLPNTEEENRSRRKLHSRYPDKKAADDDDVDMMEGNMSDLDRRRASSRPKRRSGSPKAPPGGSYRIPEKGQIQIVIKNQNKTAVKLFLVPYDLAGMEPGTKTFIRQRSYSAGPIVDAVLAAQGDAAAPADRPILRYLVHLHICCPARGRFYLYKSVRIVFANRVPDGKEKLRNETTWPEPRFSPYKPIRVMHPTSSAGGTALAAEKAFRRRSSGWAFGAPSSSSQGAAGLGEHVDALSPGTLPLPPPPLPSRPPLLASFSVGSGAEGGSSQGSVSTRPVDPIPFRLPARARLGSDVSDSTGTTAAGVRSPGSLRDAAAASALRQSTSTLGSLSPPPPGRDGRGATYEKLSKGDVGYGGNAFVMPVGQGSAGAAEGLLSQRLRSLGVQAPRARADEEASE